MSRQVDTFTFVVEPFQEDFTGQITWGTLGNLLLRSANLHASARGFGRVLLDGGVYVWVLSRLVVEMSRRPHTGETFTISTWVRSVYRSFTDRCFTLTAADGQPIGYAYSIWALINKDTREAIDLQRVMNSEFEACIDAGRPCPVRHPGRVRVKAGAPVRTIGTYYSDIDINNHVNSIRYLEHILDLFYKEMYAKRRLQRVEMAYNEETYCGEPLSFYVEPAADGNVNVEVRKNAGDGDATRGTVVCRSQLTFCDE